MPKSFTVLITTSPPSPAMPAIPMLPELPPIRLPLAPGRFADYRVPSALTESEGPRRKRAGITARGYGSFRSFYAPAGNDCQLAAVTGRGARLEPVLATGLPIEPLLPPLPTFAVPPLPVWAPELEAMAPRKINLPALMLPLTT